MANEPLDPQDVLGLTREQVPQHIAIIMDGNGRWAQSRGKRRLEGHQAGAESVRKIVTQSARLGIGYLTLYSFSNENWKRPADEVAGLMNLYAYHLVRERGMILDNNIRLLQIGRREGLPSKVLKELDKTASLSADNTGMTLQLALNYGARQEIVEAVQHIASDVADGKLKPEDIDEQRIAQSLYTAGVPDPDLLIRTAGEYRVSNFLLWQISYAEIYVCDTLWPEFREKQLHEAILAYSRRQRRFGAVNEPANSENPIFESGS